jgi:acetyl esterase
LPASLRCQRVGDTLSASLLTPAMAGLLDRIGRARRPPFHAMTPAQARAAYESAAEVLEPARAPLARVEDLTLRGADGAPLRARLYSDSRASKPPVLLYLHGGGFVIGSLETHDSLCRQLALQSGGAVLALEYRLAPEHPFPTPVDDAWSVMRWLARDGHLIGVDPMRIAVGGDSAGGTLAAACAIHARDTGLKLKLQVLITPGTTAHADTASHKLFANGFLLEAADVCWFFDHYIPHHHRRDWRFAPLEADDLEGVAPAFVLLAECDPLVDEGLAYADRLRAAGVEVELDLVRGMTHDFIKMGRALKEAGRAQQAIGAALSTAWTR